MAVIIERKGEPDYKRVKCTCCNSILRYLDVDEKTIIQMAILAQRQSPISCPNCDDKVLTWAMCATDFADYRIK